MTAAADEVTIEQLLAMRSDVRPVAYWLLQDPDYGVVTPVLVYADGHLLIFDMSGDCLFFDRATWLPERSDAPFELFDAVGAEDVPTISRQTLEAWVSANLDTRLWLEGGFTGREKRSN